MHYQAKPDARLLIVCAPCAGRTGFTSMGEGEAAGLSETSVTAD
jgi:hypothetical protein